ncbi:hypothetical protein E2B89_09605 [Salmonella enterica]|uniref:Uncharacterized protein n=1 Tax=Salmonella enterica TaxID=28901 RepID=A0A7U6BHC1_SALER|nr:hypothetical protein CHC34_07210 [Salmonella enterica]EAV3186395.1 hypothetical protein [Salmonella enterica subsp. enterica]EBH3850454.1 hypothetical protein [Salmonella enterica subsp. diarizonae]EBH8948390.1 hypothetical protein [Salmonella enterica subsp. diarizonae serovar 48:i:z]EBH9876802.1 hypothetical protein [Salmonella enterica subsp. enterica serovar 6,7:-1,5]PUU61706.1 hypothetical protein BUJ13_001820 [Salmonella enterica subsp. diarizonae serovar 60:r:e,n,x,z15]QAY25379.1 hy
MVTWRDFSPPPNACDSDNCPILKPLYCYCARLPDGASLIRPTIGTVFVGRIRQLRRHPTLLIGHYACFASSKHWAIISRPCRICEASMVSGTRMRKML